MHSTLERKSPRLARLVKELETQFKWIAIWLFFLAFRKDARRQARAFNATKVRRILVLRTDKIGDMIITLPLLHALKQHHPRVQIDVLASPSNASLLQDDDSVHRVHIYRKRDLRATFRLLRQLRGEGYDLILDLLTGASISSLMLAIMIGKGAFKLGICKDGLSRYYDYYSLVSTMPNAHLLRRQLAGLELMGVFLDNYEIDSRPRFSEAQINRAADIVAGLRLPRCERLIAYNISAGKFSRAWQEEKFVATFAEITRRFPNYQFVVFCAPDEFARGERVLAAGAANSCLVPRGLSIRDVIGMLAHFDLVMSPDTSICHIAAALDVPLLALYSGNDWNFNRWRPYGQRVWVVRSPDYDTIHGITAAEYGDALERVAAHLFKQQPTRQES